MAAIAFIDDGPGMTPKMARYALTWGGGTHHEDPVKSAGLASGCRTARSTRPSGSRSIPAPTPSSRGSGRPRHHRPSRPRAGLGAAPEEAELPEFVQDYLKRRRSISNTGTVVVWVKPDRLTYAQASTLKEHFLDDFGTTYRYLLPRQEKTPRRDARSCSPPGTSD